MNLKDQFTVLVVILCFNLPLSLPVSAETSAIDYKVITDIVYEWSPLENAIQIGDYTISDMGSVMLDNGSEHLVPAGKGKIKTGNLVRAMLIGRDENGFWKAGKIIVLTGKALTSAKNSLPETKQKELKRERLRQDSDAPVQKKQDGKQPYLEGGVWKY